jgi:hypothetical protein
MLTLLLLSSASSALAATQVLAEPVSKDNSANCDCYLTSGPDPSYFQCHRFWDFRNIPTDASGDDYSVAPPLVAEDENAGLEPVTCDYLNTTKWNSDWQIQNWASNASVDSPVMRVNSPQNVFISRNSSNGGSTYLTLCATRLPDFMSISEIDSQQKNLYHSSIRAKMRVIPNGLSDDTAPSAARNAIDDHGSTPNHPADPGAVAGLFTYLSSTEESDIEILTRDPTDRIRYSNQPDFNYKTGNTIPGASSDVAVPNKFDWTEWLEHRIDWHEGMSRWYINDNLMLSSEKNVPTDPSGLILNLWGDGGEWSGNMSVGGQVQLAIEWVEMVFNVSGPVPGSGGGSKANYQGKRTLMPWLARKVSKTCHVGCTVDGVARVGFPEEVFNSTSAASSVVEAQIGGGLSSATAVFMLGVACFWVW